MTEYIIRIDTLIAGNVLSNSIKEIARLELASDDSNDSDAREGLLAKAAVHRRFVNQIQTVMFAQGLHSGPVDSLIAMAKEDLINERQPKAADEAKTQQSEFIEAIIYGEMPPGVTVIDRDEDPSPLMNLDNCLVIILPKRS